MKAAVIAAAAAVLIAVGAAAQAEAHPNPAGSIVDPSADHPGHIMLDTIRGGDYPSFIIAMHREGNYSLNVHVGSSDRLHLPLFNNSPNEHLDEHFEWDAESVGDDGYVKLAGIPDDSILPGAPDDYLDFDHIYQVRLRDTDADSTLLFHRFETLSEGSGLARYAPIIDAGHVTYYSAAFAVTARDAGPVKVGISPDGTVGGIIGSRTMTLDASGPFDVLRGEFLGLRSGQGYTMFLTNSTFDEHVNSVDIVTALRPRGTPAEIPFWQETVRDGRLIPSDERVGGATVLTSTVSIPVERTVANIRVDLDIPHSSRGDLVVKLVSPSGDEAILHNEEGGFDNDIRGFYQSADEGALRSMDGSPTQGDWTLTVDDVDAGGRGYLGEWTLTVWYAGGDLPLLLRHIPDMTVHADTTLRFLAAATGGAGDVTYALGEGGAAGAELSDDGVFSWFPRAGDVGTHTFTITAVDGMDVLSRRSFDVEVEEPFATGIEYTVSCRDRSLPNRITFCTPSFTATPAQAYVLSQGLYRDGGSFGTHGDVERVSPSENERASTEFIPDDDRNWWVFWEPGGSRDADTSIFARYDPKPESKTSNNNGSITYTPTIESNPRAFSGQTSLLEGATLVVEEGIPGFAHAELFGAASIDGSLEWDLGRGAPPGLTALDHDGGTRFFYDGRAAAGVHEFEATVSFGGGSDAVPVRLVVQDPDPGLVRTVAISDIPDRRAYTYTLVRLQVDAYNATGDVTYGVEGPEGVTVDSDGVLRWRVERGLVGQHAVVVNATDDAGGRALAGFLVEVRPPYAQDIVINSFLTNGGNHVDNIAATVPYFDVKVQIEYHEDGAPCTDDGEVVQCTHGGVGTLKRGANERPQRLAAPDNGRDYWWAIWPSGDTKGDSSTVYLNYTWRDSDRNDPLRVWYREPPVAFNPPPFLDEGIRFAATEGLHSFIDVEARDQSEDPNLRWWLPGRPDGLLVFPYGTHSARLFYDGTPHEGEREIRVTVRDSKLGSDDESSRITQTVLLTVEPDPSRPRTVSLADIPDMDVRALSTLRFQADAGNATDGVRYFTMWAPEGARVDRDGGFEWVPRADQAGTHTVIMAAADGAGGMSSRSFTIEVSDPIAAIRGQTAGTDGELLTSSFDVEPALPITSQVWWTDGRETGTEGQPEPLSSRGALEASLAQDATRKWWREFWDPAAGPAGTDASVYARFHQGRDGFTVIPNPTPRNSPPVLDAGAEFRITLGVPSFLDVEARDPTRPHGDLSWSLGAGAPAGLSVAPAGPASAWILYDGGDVATGEGALRVAASDGEHSAEAEVALDVRAEPDGLPASYRVAVGTTLVVDVDPRGGASGFALAGAPPGGAEVGADGIFRWTPNATQAGAHTVEVSMSRAGAAESYAFRVLVEAPSIGLSLPLPQPPPGSDRIRIAEHEEYSFDVMLPQLPGLVYDLSLDPPEAARAPGHRAPPAGAELLANGTFSWTPSEAQDGERDIYFYVLPDGLDPVVSVLPLDVAEANSPPSIAPIGTVYVQAGTGASVPVNATDPDLPPQDLEVGVSSGPPGASVGASGNLTWAPAPADAGTHTVVLYVRDEPGGPQYMRSFDIVVLAAPPTLDIDNMPDRSAPALTTMRFVATPAGNAGTVSYSLAPGAPAGASMGPSGLFTWVPAAGQVGNHTIRVLASEGLFPAEGSFRAEVTAPFVDIAGHEWGPQLFGRATSTFTASSGGGADSRIWWTDGAGTFGFEGATGAVGAEETELSHAFSPAAGRAYWREFWPSGAASGTDASVYAEFHAPGRDGYEVIPNPHPFNTPPSLPDRVAFGVTRGVPSFADVAAADPTLPSGDLAWEAGPGAPASIDVFSTGALTARIVYNGSEIALGATEFALTASDGQHSASATVAVSARDQTTSLALAEIRNRSVEALSTLRFQAHAYDPSGGWNRPPPGAEFSLVDPPAGASITPDGYFEWVPGNGEHGTPDQLGTHDLEVAATDETGTVSEEFRVTVRDSFIATLSHSTSQRSCGWHSSFSATLDDDILSTNVGRDKDGAEIDYITLTDLIIIKGSESNCGRPTDGYTSYWREFWSGTGRNNFGTDASVYARIDHGRHNGVEIIPSPYRFDSAPFLQPGIRVEVAAGVPSGADIHAQDATPPDGGLTWSLGAGAPPGLSVSAAGGTAGRLQYDGTYLRPGEYPVQIRASDGSNRASAGAVLAVTPSPSPSLALADMAGRSVAALSTLRLQADAYNSTGQVRYYLDSPPAGASIDLGGLLQWVPDVGQQGAHNVTVVAADGTGTASGNVTVSVGPPIVSIGGHASTVPATDLVSTEITATPTQGPLEAQLGRTDGTALGYIGAADSLQNGTASPAARSLEHNASLAYWWEFRAAGSAPGSDAGVYAAVDPSEAGHEVVANPHPFDGPPFLTPGLRMEATRGVASHVDVAARDRTPPAGTLDWQLEPGAPEGLSVSPTGALTARITYDGAADNAGTHGFAYTVSDGRMHALADGTLVVREPGPSASLGLSGLEDRTVRAHSTLRFLAAADGAAGSASFFLRGAPAGASITAGGLFEWLPLPGQAGDHAVTVQAVDRTGSAEATFAVRVLPPLVAISSQDAANGTGGFYRHEFRAAPSPGVGTVLGQFGWGDGAGGFGEIGMPHTFTSADNMSSSFVGDPSRAYWGAFWEPGLAAGDADAIPRTDASVYARFDHGSGGFEIVPSPYPFDPAPVLPAAVRMSVDNRVPAELLVPASVPAVPDGGIAWALGDRAPPGFSVGQAGPTAARISYDGSLTVPGGSSFELVASAGGRESRTTVELEVGGASDSLRVSPIGSKRATELSTMRFQVDAHNATGDVEYLVAWAAPGAAVGDDGVFLWLPERGQRGTYDVTVVASDETGEAAASFRATVDGSPIDIRRYNFGTGTNAFGETDCSHGVRAVTERGHSGRAVKVVWIDYTTIGGGTSDHSTRDGVHSMSGTWRDGSTYGEIDGQGTISGHVNQGGYERKFLPASDLTYWLMMWRGDKWTDAAIYAHFEPCVNAYEIVPNPVPFNGRPFLDGGQRFTVHPGVPSDHAVSARDRTAPAGGLTWSLAGGAPESLSVSADGPLSGTISYDGRPMELGEYAFTMRAHDEGLTGTARAVLSVEERPESLYVVGIGDREVRALSTLRAQAVAGNADGPVEYSLQGSPYGASVDGGGTVTWVPEEGQEGNHTVTVVASDRSGSARASFAVAVSPPIASIDGVAGRLLQSGDAESTLSATPTAGAVLARAWALDVAPLGPESAMEPGGSRDASAEFEVVPSRTHLWEIRESGAGQRTDASIYVRFYPGQDGYEVIPNPHAFDAAPYVDGAVWLDVTEGQAESIDIEAFDDADPPVRLTWGLEGEPDSVDITSTGDLTARIDFGGNERGYAEHEFTVTVSDGTGSSSVPATLVVRDSGYDPTAIDGLPDRSIEHGQLLTFLMPEGPAYRVSNDSPMGAEMVGLDDRLFKWTPEPGQVGLHNVTIESFSGAISDSGTFEVDVFAPGSGLPDHDLERDKGEGWLRPGVREKYDLRFLANDDHFVMMEDETSNELRTIRHSDLLANDAYWDHEGTGDRYGAMSIKNTFNGDCGRHTVPRALDFTNSFNGGWTRMEPPKDFSGFALMQYGPGPGSPYTVDCDSPVATLIVEVLPVNDAPTLGGQTGHELEEGGMLDADLGAADVDSPEGDLAFTLSGAPAGMRAEGGRLVWNTTEADGPGTYRFNVTVSDGEGNSTATHEVNVTEANRPPVITEPARDGYTAELGALLEVPFAASDPDVPAQALAYRIASQDPPDANVTIGAGGNIVWSADEPSFVAVELEVADNATEPGVARKTVTLASPPSALPGTLNAVDDRFDLLSGRVLPLTVLRNDATSSPGIDLRPATLRIVEGPHHHEVVRVNVRDGLDDIQYRPAEGFSGFDTLTYEVSAGIHTARANATIRVDGFRLDQPERQQATENVTLTYLMPVTNPAGSDLAWAVMSGPEGDASVNSTGHFTWTPGELDGGASERRFSIRATDNFTTSDATLRVEVAEANLPPSIVAPAPPTAMLGVPFELALAATDPDRPAQNLTFAVLSENSTDGITVGAENGTLSWTPLVAETAAVRVRVSDGFDPPGTAEADVALTSVPGPALRGTGPLEVTALSTLRVDAEALHSDGPVEYGLAAAPEGARINRHGQLTWVPSAEQTGEHRITIRAADGAAASLLHIDVTVARQIATPIGHSSTSGGLDLVDFRAGAAPVTYRLWHMEGGNHTADGPASALGAGQRPPYPYFSPSAGEGRAHYVEAWRAGTEPATDASVYMLFEPGADGLRVMPNPHTFANYPPSLAGVETAHLATVGRNFTLSAAAEDPDLPPQALRYEILSQNVTGAAEVDPRTGLLRWEPGAAGALEVAVRVTDGHDPPENDTAVITVEARDPTELELRADYARTTMGAEVAIPVLANDTITPPGRPYEVSVTDRGGAGASIRADGDAVLYDPAGGFAGADSFEYTVTARSVTEDVSASANVTVEVVPVGRVYADTVDGASATFVAAMDGPGEYLWSVETPAGAPAGAAAGSFTWPPSGGAGYATISTQAPGNGLAHGEQYRLKVELPGSEPIYADFATLPAGDSARHLPRLVSLGAVSHDRIEAEYLFRDPGPHEIAPDSGSGPDLMLVTVADSPGTLATANATLTGLEPSTDYTVHVRPPSVPDFAGAASFPLGRTAALAAPAITSVSSQGDTATFEIDGMGSGVRARLASSGGDLLGEATPLGHSVTLEASGLEDGATYVVEIRVAHYPWESRHTAYYAYSHLGTGASQITNDPPMITTAAAGHRASSGIDFELDVMWTDPDPADTVTFAIVGDGLGAVLTPGGSLTWTPAPAQAGEQRITVRATDSDGQTDDLELAITVDTSPYVYDDANIVVSTVRNAPLLIDVLSSATIYPPGAEVTVMVDDVRAGDPDAAETRVEDGAIWFLYPPNLDSTTFPTLYTFGYILSIPDADTYRGTIIVTVSDVENNQPPAFAPVQTEWDLPVGRDFTLDLDATDPEGQRVGYSIADATYAPENATDPAAVDPATGILTLDGSAPHVARVNVTASDGTGGVAWVVIDATFAARLVAADDLAASDKSSPLLANLTANDLPPGGHVASVRYPETGSPALDALLLLGPFAGAWHNASSGDPLPAGGRVVAPAPANSTHHDAHLFDTPVGSFTLVNNTAVRYEPSEEAPHVPDGTVISLRYELGHGSHGPTAHAFLNITLGEPGEAFAAADVGATTAIGVPVPVSVLGAAEAEPGRRYHVDVSQPSNGAALVLGTSVLYQPDACFVGRDAFGFEVRDLLADSIGGAGMPSAATVTVDVLPPALEARTLVGEPVAASPFPPGSECGGTGVTIPVQPARGSATASGGEITYVPAPGSVGEVQVEYDVGGARGTLTVLVHRPISIGEAAVQPVPEGGPVSYPIPLVNPDGAPVEWSILSGPPGAAVDASGTFAWDAPAGGARAEPYAATVRADVAGGGDGAEGVLLVRVYNSTYPYLEARDDVLSATHDSPQALPVLDNDVILPAIDSNARLPDGTRVAITVSYDGDSLVDPRDRGIVQYRADEPGTESFGYTISAGGASSSATATVTAAGFSFRPTVPQSVDELEELVYLLPVNNPGGIDLAWSIPGEPRGSEAVNGTGHFTWTPTEEEGDGIARHFTVRATGGGISREAVVTATASEVNQAPVIAPVAGAHAAEAGEEFHLDLDASDADRPAQPLRFSIAAHNSTAALGVPAVDQATGNVTWTPAEPATVRITVNVTDGFDPPGTDSVELVVSATEDNLPPSAPPAALTIPEDSGPAAVAPGFSDPNGGASITAAEVTTEAPIGEVVGFNSTHVTYAPSEDANGEETISYTVTDEGSPPLSATGTITVTVEGVNDAPVLDAIGDKSIDAGRTLRVEAGAADIDGGTPAFAFEPDAAPAGGPGQDSFDSATGVLLWAVPGDHPGATYDVAVSVDDARGGTDREEFSITVRATSSPQNRPPTAEPSSNTTAEDVPITVTPRISDPDGTPVITAVTDGAHGTANHTRTTVTYSPGQDFNGTDVVTYTVTDGSNAALTAEADITITVVEVNDAPVLQMPGDEDALEGRQLRMDANATDPDDAPVFRLDAGGIPLGAGPNEASFDAATGVLEWVPGEERGGTSYVITVTADDLRGGTASGTAVITVAEDNKPPVFGALEPRYAAEVGRPFELDLDATDADDPAQGVSFHLLSANTTVYPSIDAVTGVVAWGPDRVETLELVVGVSDTGSPRGETEATVYVDALDTTAPTIRLNPPDVQQVELGGAYTELGATASDAGGPLQVSIDASDVDTGLAGDYTVRYDATDADGNAAERVTRTVQVRDTTDPTIELAGPDPQRVELGGAYTELGATATDNDPAYGERAATPDASAVDAGRAGSYAVTYTAPADAAGRTSTAQRAVEVSDTTDPTVALSGDNPQVIEVGGAYTELGATATDNDPAYGVQTARPDASAVDTGAVGMYDVAYTAPADGAGRTSTAVRTVSVVDGVAPVISLDGDDPQHIELGGRYVELGATASDAGGPVQVVIDASDVDTGAAGDYEVRYDATDAEGNAADRVTRAVEVRDTTGPRITLAGGASVTVGAGDAYSDAGASVSDNDPAYAGTVSSNATDVSTAAAGRQVVEYTAPPDAAGNPAEARLRTVIVNAQGAPDISVLGARTLYHELGTPYVDPGASSDGPAVVPSSNVNPDVAGTYEVRYTATADGLTGTAVRTVIVRDTTPPSIELRGQASVPHPVGEAYIDAGAGVGDNDPAYAGTVSSNASSVRTGAERTYYIVYTAPADAAGLSPEPAVREVRVHHPGAPSIAVLGDDPLYHELGTAYSDPGARSNDGSRVTDNSTAVDEGAAGTYRVAYSATDADGLTGTATRDVIVRDTTPPSISLRGPAAVSVAVGTPYDDPGADVADNDPAYAGEASDNSTAIDTAVAGAYTVAYTAPADAAGNAPEPAVRRVGVHAPGASAAVPAVTLLAVSDAAATAEGRPVVIDVRGNDRVAPAGTDAAVSLAQPANGRAGVNANGTVTYTPDPGFSGTDTFTYSLRAGGDSSGTASVTVTVEPAGAPEPGAPPNEPPVAPDSSHTIDEDGALVFRPAVSDPDGPAPEITSVTQGAHGAASHTGDTITYEPGPDFHGADSVAYTVADSAGEPAAGTVYVTVREVNDPPEMGALAGRTVDEGDEVAVTASATDRDGDAVTFGAGAGGLPAGAELDALTGVLTWAPGGGDGGASYDVNVTAHDGRGGSDSAVVTIEVVDVADVARTDPAERVRRVVSGAAAGQAVTFGPGQYAGLGALLVVAEGVTLAPAPGAAVTLTGDTSVHVLAAGATVRGFAFDGITAPEAVRAVATEGLTVAGNAVTDSRSGVVVCGAACDFEYPDPAGWAASADICRVGEEACAAQTSAGARAAPGEVSSDALVSGNTFAGMSHYSVANLAGGTLNAKRNHHGEGGAAFGGVSADPWYADPARVGLVAAGAPGQPPVPLDGGDCGVSLGRPAVPFSNARWGHVSDVEEQELTASGGAGITGVTLVATPWEGAGGEAYPGAVTQVRAAGASGWADVGALGAEIRADVPPGGSLGIELRLSLEGAAGAGHGSLGQRVTYLATCS